MLRPLPARWFEVLVAHDDAVRALEALAATGAVELELRPGPQATTPLAELKPLLDRHAELTARFAPYWPEPAGHVAGEPLGPRATLERALERLAQWREVTEAAIHTLQEVEQEAADLDVWQALFERFRDAELDFALLRRPDAVLARRLYVFPSHTPFSLPADVMARRFELKDQACVLVLGPAESIAALDRQAASLKGRRSGLGIPGWLQARAADNLPHVARRLVELRASAARLRALIDDASRRYDLARHLAEVERLRWFGQEVHVLSGTGHFAWLTGWTSDLRGRALAQTLEFARVRALLRFPSPPPDARAPLILSNPWWARPFELFARAIGVPGSHEVDPSPLLALIVPLLFGYMFGDVGHGLVLAAVGFTWRRHAVARLLVVGGISSMAFGVLYGSVFAREDLIPALWLHPLDKPLLLLGAPLALGASLLVLGQLLAGIEAGWRNRFGQWLGIDAGMLVCYLGALGGLAVPSLFGLAAAGVLWYVAGHTVQERRWMAVAEGIGSAMEHVFQLAVNTLSFARVGAFALAHAGLSSAVVSLAASSDSAVLAALILAVGNAIVIVLEGLVVSIQTTRLVLFEFFIRFLRGEGRAFQPLVAPPSQP
jgi:V/A-type H+-transporting ATPase subunit I